MLSWFTFWGHLSWQWGSEFEVPVFNQLQLMTALPSEQQVGEKSNSTSSKSSNKAESELRDQKWTFSHLLSDGRRESKASADSFLLSGWVMLSMRSTHISITLPNNWSIWWDVMGDVEKRWIIRGVVIILRGGGGLCVFIHNSKTHLVLSIIPKKSTVRKSSHLSSSVIMKSLEELVLADLSWQVYAFHGSLRIALDEGRAVILYI